MRRINEIQQISIVDDDLESRDVLYALMDQAGFPVRTYAGARQFLSDFIPRSGCLIANIHMPDMDGLDLQDEMVRRGIHLPVIFVTDHANIKIAVKAIKAGAIDYIEKPLDRAKILASVEDALLAGEKSHRSLAEMEFACAALKLLTPRERHVLDQLAMGRSNKIIAHELGISARTVEFHRAHIMGKLNARHMADVLRVSLTAELACLNKASKKFGSSERRAEYETEEAPLWTGRARQARLF
jgi:two-component system response regulator FixJ